MSWIADGVVRGLRAFVVGLGPGDVVSGRYELGQQIGEGAMGVVFAGRDRETGHDVAIKILRGHDEHDDARFDREAGAIAGTTHPAVVDYIAHGVHSGERYVVMERLSGRTLADRLTLGHLSGAETIALGRRVAGGLAAVHATGITHRDLKPSNLFLVGGSVVDARIVDFGLARPGDAPTLTGPDTLVGTPGYMAPEQVRRDRDIGPPADVFALGCVLWECLAGRPPFVAESDETLFARILLEEAPRLDEIASEASSALSAVVARMLDKDPSRRPSATEVAACLDGISCAVPSTTASEVASPRLLAPGIAEGTIFAHHYRVEGLLGAGGMGVVVSARHTELGTLVALKLLRPGSRADPSRFLREARAASQLESEHSVRVLEFGRADDGTPYLIMEHLKGRDLAARLAEDGPLSVEMAVTYVLETCEAIAEAHALGIVHRDLKPSNLFLVRRRDGSEIVKVLDFGISKMSDSREDTSRPLTVTDPEVVLGSVPYMSPEQLQASTHVDARADVWSLGIVLHELLTGKRPFEAATAPAIAARIVGAEPIRLRDVRPDAPGLLEDVILACLAKAPFRRYPNLAAFAGALRPFASHQASASIDRVVRLLGLPDDESTRPSTTLERASRSPARGKPTRARVTKAVALAAGVFGLAGIAYASWPRRTSDRSTTPPLEASVSSREPARDSTSPTAASPTVPSAALPPPSSEPTASLTTAASSPLVAGGRAPAAPRRPATVSPPVRPSAARAGDARPNSRLDLRDPNLERR